MAALTTAGVPTLAARPAVVAEKSFRGNATAAPGVASRMV